MSPLPTCVLLALALVAPAAAQKVFLGSCPTVDSVTAWDPETFAETTWYEARRYYSWLEKSTRCVSWTYGVTNGDLSTATTVMTDVFGNTKTMVATLTADTAGTSDYSYVITDLPGSAGALPGTYDYKIIAYDAATGYAVAWSCRDIFFGLKSEQLLWVLTDTQTPTTATTTAAITAISGLGLNTGTLLTVSQTSC